MKESEFKFFFFCSLIGMNRFFYSMRKRTENNS